MIVNYRYYFKDWDSFVDWLLSMGFKRYEYGMPCRRGYERDGINITVSYWEDLPNTINNAIAFNDPNEIPQEILQGLAR